MTFRINGARARVFQILAFAAAQSLAPSALAQDPAALELDEAAQLAVGGQPLLEAQSQAVRAARESSIADSQLPDPTLVGGVTDLTLEGPNRYTLRDEADTQLVVGVKQTFPGGGKSALRGSRGQAEAARLDAELREQERMVRREAGLAWLDAWKAIRAQELIRSSISEAERQEQVVEIAYRAGRASQADLIASRVSRELLADELANLQQQEGHARNQLRRWIGEHADRVICPDLPAWRAPQLEELLQHLDRHPHVTAQDSAVQLAQADLALARAEYRPDWSVQIGYGHRPEFADYASLQFEIGLPVFTANRQDRRVEARGADVARYQSTREDWLRQHRADIRLNVTDWQSLQQRLARYDEIILPQAQKRLDVALAAYGAGGATLVSLLDARRSLQDIRMQRLGLELDAARHQVALQYFLNTSSEGQP